MTEKTLGMSQLDGYKNERVYQNADHGLVHERSVKIFYVLRVFIFITFLIPNFS